MFGIIDYQPQRGPIQKHGDLICSPSIKLTEGLNEVDIDEWSRIADTPAIKSRIEAGVIRPTFAPPTIVTVTEKSTTTRKSTPIETKLAAQPETTPEVVDVSAFVTRPPEVEKTPTPPKK